jgi:uroporphyrinogen III methyltransferase/synthase
VTRTAAQAEGLITALLARGLEPVVIPTIEIRPVEPGGELDAAIRRAVDASWIVVTSANAVVPVLEAAARLGVDLGSVRWAAVGTASRAALEARGMPDAFVPGTADSESLATGMPIEPGDTVFLPRTDISDTRLVAALEGRGARVDAVVAYRTVEGPETSREELRALFAGGGPEAIVFTSASTVRGLAGLLGRAHLDLARRVVACCIGEPTATAARNAGFERVLVAPAADAEALAGLVRTAVPASPTEPAPEPRQEDPA